eukprot:TRINITY_DN12878_c0_g1_i1.p1 TRINITY_DN12878_c0_g1~~TRINITY_DN12878_c0_g1_i1.p1  ORF type:complete len:174 (+),score=40.01 TRINITY_DN12878_c0_g1_i1:307-828(+)
MCKCYIKGDDENVERAKQMLLTIAMQIEDDSSEYIDLPKASSGAVIGSQGSRIRDFQTQTGARIDVDKTGPTCRVRLSGTRDQVDYAKALILLEVDKGVSTAAQMATPKAAATISFARPVVIASTHQPTSFPATLSESIARAKAAAQAIKSGMVTSAPVGTAPDYDSFANVAS